MAIDLTKVPLLSHVKYLYGDLRDRIKDKYSKPEEGIPASDLAPGVIPDIGLIENGKAPIIMETASGNPIVITDGAAGLPLSECKLTLLPRQSGSGDASPENIRPLIPWENVGIWTGGKNLLNLNRTEGTPNPTDLSSYTSPRVMDTEHYYRGIQSANYYYKTYAEATVGNEEIRVTATNNNGYGVGLPVRVKGGTHYTLNAVAENALVIKELFADVGTRRVAF